MAVGPIGNAIYVNQQMASVASEKNAILNRFELQALAAATVAREEKKEIEEVRPAEENHAVNPDREHTRQEADEEEKERRHTPEPELSDEELEPPKPLHLLDIKV